MVNLKATTTNKTVLRSVDHRVIGDETVGDNTNNWSNSCRIWLNNIYIYIYTFTRKVVCI